MTVCCTECFNNGFIKDFIRSLTVNGDCSFCGSQGVLLAPMADLGAYLRRIIEGAYARLSYPLYGSFSLSPWDPSYLISILQTEEDIFSDKLKGSFDFDDLTHSSYNVNCINLLNAAIDASKPAKGQDDLLDGRSFSRLMPKGAGAGRDKYTSSWESFKYHARHYSRFFDFGGSGVFREEILEPVGEALSDMEAMQPAGLPLWRSRVMQGQGIHGKSREILAAELGPAPLRLSANNRMSPAGISYTYLAEDKETCIAEIRPHVGDYVWAGEFRTTRELRILDLGAIRGKTRSIFAPGFRPEMKRIPSFLEAFSEEISKPVSPADAALEYVPTQVFCEFIRTRGFDGLRFKSSQFNYKKLGFSTSKYNYVLFCGPSESSYGDAPAGSKRLTPFGEWLELHTCVAETIYEVQYKAYMRRGSHGGGDMVSF